MDPITTLLSFLTGMAEPAMAKEPVVQQPQQPQEQSQKTFDFYRKVYNMGPITNGAEYGKMAKLLNTRNVRNNNPGNIKDFGIPWAGKIDQTDPGGNVAEGSFVRFQTPEYGIRALIKDLTTKRTKGIDTIEKILAIYAPAGKENNTKAYINTVSKNTGLKPDQPIEDKHMFDVVKGIIGVEGGPESLQYYTDDIIKGGFNLLKPQGKKLP